MVRELKNHPGYYMEDAAAVDFDRMEDAEGVFNVTSARRTESEQQGLIDRWDRGGVYNRPPYLYEPYRPARLGPHVKNGGIAVDVTDWQRLMRVMSRYHFTHPYDWDVVHFEHDGNRDTLNSLSTTAKTEPKEDEMTVTVKVDNRHYFTIGEEFISHNGSLSQAYVTRNVNSIIDEEHRLVAGEFWDYLDGMGVPRDVVNLDTGAVLNPQSGQYEGNGTWSRRREAVALSERIARKLGA